MANAEHLEVVKKGKAAIEQWRKQHPKERLDLSRADLGEANLSGADLIGANLFRANLSEANLSAANLRRANLIWADLRRANLFRANLSEANLSAADLFRANLGDANLSGADLIGANLGDANLSRADLFAANLSRAYLRAVNLSAAVCVVTVFGDCDLSSAKGLDSVVHIGPSTIGIDTLITSFRGIGNRLTPELETFFRGAGVPKNLLAELLRILAEVQYCTAFICYGEPDLSFTQGLYQDLTAKGVSCWLYSMDATPGKRTWKEIVERRREAEKMIVLCSAGALVRDGVLKEVEEQIDEDPDKMLPISLDNLWKEGGFKVMRGSRDLKPFLLERNYADFSDPAKYEKSLQRLLKGLERKKVGPNPD